MKIKDITLIVPLASGRKINGISEIKKQKIKCIPVYGTNPSANRNIGVKKAKTGGLIVAYNDFMSHLYEGGFKINARFN